MGLLKTGHPANASRKSPKHNTTIWHPGAVGDRSQNAERDGISYACQVLQRELLNQASLGNQSSLESQMAEFASTNEFSKIQRQRTKTLESTASTTNQSNVVSRESTRQQGLISKDPSPDPKPAMIESRLSQSFRLRVSRTAGL